ncbi:MAG TPA: glycosyltransferase [Flexivirga sp.]|uniref:glycosyltransferase n=1 Tax=Flexivirga sp. TaxID=1962927 RepID=UPI002B7A6099|nr:glycosyltransferase [Flexivirga sp.]HWC22129.1 glycosyltransferase [Flexivirga sp.]
MRILMPFLGSRGDVQPGVALALELRRRGHDVRLGVPPNLVDFARRAGIDVLTTGPDSAALLESELVQHRIKSANPRTRWRGLSELGTFGWTELALTLDDEAADSDLIVSCFLGQEVARALADKHRLAQVAMHYYPIRPSESVHLLPDPPFAAESVHHLTWWLADRSWRLMTRRGEDSMRAELGLGPSRTSVARRMTNTGSLELQAIDPILFPQLGDEWGVRRPLVGFLDLAPETRAALDDDGDGDGELDAWLDQGRCIYWGFGSMPVASPEDMVQMVREVSQRLGCRALVAAGWSNFADSGDDDLRIVRSVDHHRVLPRCVAAVHHGGAGTTAAALRAGIPSLISWFNADQPLWGRRLAALGVGDHRRFRDLSADECVTALTPLLATATQDRARKLAGRLITPADAVRAAADAVELQGFARS